MNWHSSILRFARLLKMKNGYTIISPARHDVIPQDLVDSVDEYGSLVTVDPVDWIVCFVPGLKQQWWHRFAHERHKHVFAMRPVDDTQWLIVEPWWTRMMVTTLPTIEAVKFLRWGATGTILRVKEAIPGNASQMRGWSNCAVLTCLLLGRSSRAWTPHGLYNELVREEATREEDVEDILTERVEKVVTKHFGSLKWTAQEYASVPLREALTVVGKRFLQATINPSVIEMFALSILEAERHPTVARVFAEYGFQIVTRSLIQLLENGARRGEIEPMDYATGAGQFLGMLHGNLRLESALQLRHAPTPRELHLRSEAAAATFLDGILPRQAETCQPTAAPSMVTANLNMMQTQIAS